nr:MAG TPA: hypothetical protein [Bacteriophage sp.]
MQYLDKTGLARLWNNIKAKLSNKEDSSNKVTLIDSTSTNNQYPSAKAVKEYVDKKQTYSTDEIVVGTWIDGKPIYRKVVDIGDLPNNTSKYIDHNINIETPIKCSGICYNSAASMVFTLPMCNIHIWLDINQICVLTTVDRTNTTAKAIIEYTKTTD